jgi:hypothetical protein
MAPRTKVYIYLEVAEDKYTAGVARISMAANYRVFSLLANVRNDGGVTPVAPVRGFPDKLSKGAEEFFKDAEAEGSALHSKTFLTTEEVERAQKLSDGFVAGLVAAAASMRALEGKGASPRLVVAFAD